MQYVPMDGGQSWEWEHDGLTYQVISFTRSTRVLVYAEKLVDPGDWTFLFGRLVNGRSAQTVAQDIFAEVIGGKIEMSIVMARAASAFAAALAVERTEGEKSLARATDRLNEATDGMSPGELRVVADAARRLSEHCEWLLGQ